MTDPLKKISDMVSFRICIISEHLMDDTRIIVLVIR